MSTELDVHETMDLDAATPVEPQQPASQPATDAAPAQAQPKESPRDIAVRAIAESRMRKLAEELAYGETLTDEAHDLASGQEIGTTSRERAAQSADTNTTQPAQTATTTPQTAEAAQPTTTPATVSQPQRRIVTINGQQFALTDDELVQLATVGAQATAYAHQMRQQQQQQPAPQQPQPQQQLTPAQPRVTTSPFDREQAVQLVRRLSYSPEEDAAGALEVLYQRARDDAVEQMRAQLPQFDPTQVVAQASQQALQQMRFEQNLLTIGQEYPDIFNNTRLSQLAALTLHDIRQRDAVLNRQRSDLELYREACNEVRATIAPQQPQSATPASQPQPVQLQPSQAASATSPTRVARKREAPQQPQAVAQRVQLEPEERKHPTGSEIVEQYRRQRGQVPLH